MSENKEVVAGISIKTLVSLLLKKFTTYVGSPFADDEDWFVLTVIVGNFGTELMQSTLLNKEEFSTLEKLAAEAEWFAEKSIRLHLIGFLEDYTKEN